MLDGFLMLHSCKVKLPHEAQHSRLSGMNIVDVVIDDLAYFKNLLSIDLSDNQVKLEWLKTLESVEDVDLQYNQITSLEGLEPGTLQKVKYLHLSYNSIPSS